jgi:hypothetical protein
MQVQHIGTASIYSLLTSYCDRLGDTRWAELVALIGDKRDLYKLQLGKTEGKGHKENLQVGRRIILKCILERKGGVMWTGLVWFRIGISGDLS